MFYGNAPGQEVLTSLYTHSFNRCFLPYAVLVSETGENDGQVLH